MSRSGKARTVAGWCEPLRRLLPRSGRRGNRQRVPDHTRGGYGWALLCGLILALTGGPAAAATFGKVAAIGGHAVDLALDPTRGLLYVANFSANRVEVIRAADGSPQTSIQVFAPPSAVAVSGDGRYLLVGHYGNFTEPMSPANGLTVIDLETRGRQTISVSAPVLGAAFGSDGLGFAVTNTEFLLVDPAAGTVEQLETISTLVAKTLPVAAASPPLEVTGASVSVSGDGHLIYGMAGSTNTFTFRYRAGSRLVEPGGIVLAKGLMGPRVVSLNQDGTRILAGWTMIDERGNFVSYFKNKSNQAAVGTTAFDPGRGLVYAQIPERSGEPPVFQILDADNLTVRERLKLPENLTGKSTLSPDGEYLYGVSESGVLMLPVGSLATTPRLAASVEDVVFRGNFCDRRPAAQEIEVIDPGGGRTPFRVKVSGAGVSVTPSEGVTPARVRIAVDPNVLAASKGTAVVLLALESDAAVNLAPPVRVLVNFREPDQRGTFVNVPGELTDILADPERDRFYVLRQDRNQVLVFDANTYAQVAVLRTYNSPTSLAITFDRRYLLVGHNSAQVAAVFDLDTLEAQPYISTDAGAGNEARSIAVSARRILAASVDFEGKGHVIELDLETRQSSSPPSLGVYNNEISPQTVAVGSPHGGAILFGSADGNLLLYDSSADTFTVSRKDPALGSGAYAASAHDTYVVGKTLLNASLVAMGRLDAGAGGTSSGFVFSNRGAYASVSLGTANPGLIQRVDAASGATLRSTRTTESPLAGSTTAPFTRTLALMSHGQTLVSLSVSGFTILPATYDEPAATPLLSRVVNAADQRPQIASGSLVTVFGQNLSPVNIATSELPLPTALGESCLTVNGMAVPVLFVSPQQINAQIPYSIEGRATLILRTPGGVSDSLNLTILPSAPAVFRSRLAGADQEVAMVVREKNKELVTLSNPIHRGDRIVIFLAGLGRTLPSVEAGRPAPSQPPTRTVGEPQVTLGGAPVGVLFSGLSPGQVGIYEIHALIPGDAPTGVAVPLEITLGESTAVSVRVVN